MQHFVRVLIALLLLIALSHTEDIIVENGMVSFDESKVYSTGETINFGITINSTIINTINITHVDIFFGDEKSCSSHDASKTSMEYDSNTYTCIHSYSTEGNFTVFGVLNYTESIYDTSNRTEGHSTMYGILNYTEHTYATSSRKVYVWNKINVTIESRNIVGVAEPIEFEFEFNSASKFLFTINFGDQSNFSNESEMIQESNQLNTTFVHEYNTPGVYNVTLKAWNTLFIQIANKIVRVEYPIPEGSLMLSPETDNIPFPDGKIDMFLNYTGSTDPDPTNVRCIFQYGDDVEEKLPVNLTNGKTIHNVHFYESTGTKDVNFTCTNDLSEQSVFATIYVGPYNLSDFKFEYEDPVPMNMTLNGTQPTENYRHYYESETVPVIVTFKISLKNFSRFPPDINVTWNFGDGSPNEIFTLESKTRIHTYTGHRGIHDMVIKMASKTENITFHRNITLGVASFHCTPQNVTIGETVTCEVQGIPVNSTYDIDTDSTDSTSAYPDKANNHTFSIIYQKYGFYIPSVFTKAGEKIYLDQPIISDYDLENVLDLNIRPDQVPLPPGNVSFNVSSDKFRPYVYCSMTSGDAVDRDGVYQKNQNITYSEPLVFDYVYTSLGTHTVNVMCWNYVSNKTFLENVTVINACFDSNGIFDRHYSLSSQPMPVYTSDDVYISNRMNILCNDEKPNFKWKIYEANVQGNTDKDTQYENPLNEEKGTLLIKRGKLPEGMYYILLNVSLSTTWITEWMYINFTTPLPQAYITGGDYVLGAWDYKFDALTESHTANGDLGDNQNLTFTWECKRVSPIDLTEPTINLKKTTGNLCNVELSPGVVQIPDDKQTPSDYAVTVTVKERKSEKKFTQIANLRGGNATKLRINCILNCNDKVAVSSKIALEAECDSCKPEDDVRYFWQLWTNDSGRFHPWQNIATMIGKDNSSHQSLVLPKFFLNSSQTYLVTLSMNMMKGVNKTEVKGTIYRKLETNKPPSGGNCSVGLKTDPPMVLLSVNCSDWKDPDGDDVFIYLYETVTKRNLHHGQENVVSFLYEGGERSILDVPIQFGDPYYSHVVMIRVRVFDFFGDYGTFSKDIKVKQENSFFPVNETDISTIDKTFQNCDSKFNNFFLSGNDIQTLNLISAVASSFRLFPYEDRTTTEDEVTRGAEILVIDTSGGGPVFPAYQQKVITLLKRMKTVVTPGCTESEDRFNLADLQTIFSTMDALTRYQPYLSMEAVHITTEIVDSVISCLETGSRRRPFPTRSVENLNDIATVLHHVLNNILNKMLPEKLQDLYEELSEEAIKGDIIIGIKRSLQERDLLHMDHGNITLNYGEINRGAYMLYRIRSHHRKMQILQRDTAKKFIPMIKEILNIFGNVLQKTVVVGERISFEGLGVLDIMIRKLSSKDLVDAPDKFFVNLNKVNGSKNQDPYYDIAVFNFLKNPYIYGENASAVTSSVPVMEIPPNITVDTKVPNDGKLYFKRYIPLINPQYSEQMIYFTFDIINDGDAAIIFFKPDGFDISIHKTTELYSFFFSSVTFPTSKSYKKDLGVRDWTRFGYKIFLKEGVCGKGICYLGIKPLTVFSDDHSKLRKRRAAESLTTTSEAPDNGSTILNTTKPANISDFVPRDANFSIIFMTTGCRTWDNINNSWTTEGCRVLPMSDLNNTVCRCVGDTFSSSFYVPPNVINFLTVWGKFDASNAAVYGTLIAVFVVYIILLIVLRKQDRRDANKWGVTFLSDHSAEHVYFYMISVFTGVRRGTGTRSNVHFILTGDYGDSGIRALNDNNNDGFSTASVKMFLFGTNDSLGDIKYVRVWHDNSGPPGEQSWFLSKIIVDDLQTNERYLFDCNKWLAVDNEDCMLDRMLPVSAPSVTSFKSRFSDETQSQLFEHHLWLSLLIRPKQSNFTRVQRLTCLLALLCLIMISNAMYFKASSETENSDQITVGVFRFSFATLYVSCMGIIISTPPIIFAAFAFRHSSSEKSRKNSDNYSSNSNKKENSRKTDTFWIDGEVLNSRKGRFPRWVYFVAWILVLLAIVASSFFLILYSMEWGKAKSEEWLSSFVISFLESLFVVDPVKVIFIAIIMSTILKNLMQEDRPNLDLQKLRSAVGANNTCRETRFSDLTSEVLPTCDIYSKEELTTLREKCREESQARSALTNLILFTVYILAIYGISFMQRDPRSFNMKQNLDSYLLSGQHGFSNIKSHKDFLRWISSIFIPTFYPNVSYAGTPLSVIDRQWLKDMKSIRVGPARLRQVRMQTGKCQYTHLPWSYPCIDTYSEKDEDQHLYCLQWRSFNDTLCGRESYRGRFYTAEAWEYTDASEIWGLSRDGEYNTYSGGGYILKFVKNRVNAHLLLDEIVQYKWINRNTRAVFLEFTTYNPNVNLFVYAMFLVEFPEVGGALTWTDTQAFKPVLNLVSLHFSMIVFYMIFMLYYIYLLFKMIWQFKEHGCLVVLKEPWNCIECLCIFLAYGCLVIFVFRMKSTNKAMDMFYEDKLTGANRFINFGHIVMWDNAFNVLFSTLVFVSTIQILKILGYNKRFVEVISVMANAGKDLIAFGVLLLVSFVAFVLYGYLVFGSKLEQYKSLYATCGSLANTFIGKNRLDPLVVAAPLAAQFFYMTYAVFIIMFMVTIFMSILNSSISLVRAETAETSNKIGMMEIVKKQFENFCLFFYNPRKRNVNKNTPSQPLSEEVNAVNVMGLIRDIVTVYGKRGTKLVERKYYEESKLRLLSNDIDYTDKAAPPNDDIFIQKSCFEDPQRLCESNTDLKDVKQRMSESSELSESSVDLLIDSHGIHNTRLNTTFSTMF